MLRGAVGVRIPRKWLSPRHEGTKFWFGLLRLLRSERVDPAIAFPVCALIVEIPGMKPVATICVHLASRISHLAPRGVCHG